MCVTLILIHFCYRKCKQASGCLFLFAQPAISHVLLLTCKHISHVFFLHCWCVATCCMTCIQHPCPRMSRTYVQRTHSHACSSYSCFSAYFLVFLLLLACATACLVVKETKQPSTDIYISFRSPS